MKYFLTEFYKFKILIVISIAIGAIALPPALNYFEKSQSISDSFELVMLNRSSSIEYFIINANLKSNVLVQDLVIKPKNNTLNLVPLFVDIFLSDDNLKKVSNSSGIKVSELKMNLNIWYKFPSDKVIGNPLEQFYNSEESSPVLKIVLTDDLAKDSGLLVLNEISLALNKLGLYDSDFYFENNILHERGELGDLKNFQAPFINKYKQNGSNLGPIITQILGQEQFKNKLNEFSGVMTTEFNIDGRAKFNFLRSDRQEITDIISFLSIELVKALELFQTRKLNLNLFIVVDDDDEYKTEASQSDNPIFESIFLGGLIGLFLSSIIIYGNILRKDISEELKKSKKRH